MQPIYGHCLGVRLFISGGPRRRHARRGTHESNDETVSVYLFNFLIHGRGHLFGSANEDGSPSRLGRVMKMNGPRVCVSQMDDEPVGSVNVG
jgi:hypothetical protein